MQQISAQQLLTNLEIVGGVVGDVAGGHAGKKLGLTVTLLMQRIATTLTQAN